MTNLDSLNLSGNTLLVEEVPSEICQGEGGYFWSGAILSLILAFAAAKRDVVCNGFIHNLGMTFLLTWGYIRP